ncbi:TIGR01621 family pseudouridine synthase [Alteromonas sp. ASW11-130]|uniref:TIGR01621 family pseudouridine synthase n=1 Tax=Alteromonas sp. ASW11-130 TaxID=3015775 RepID=UPI002241CC5E|nr:TIGR01621 family pseudouridine synthase [Alteromonas sp. ASW11-130]MCW8093123.1 TIGR01621 family pseudouridine synthase [Alteromonas sp. ASW11-130]
MINIVFEHRDFVIVDKPVGMLMHDSERGIVLSSERETGAEKLHLCHRLDTGTSGCVILAKHPAAAAKFQRLFSQRKIKKFYLAVADQKPNRKQGTVIGDMKNRRRGQYILVKTRENPAVTQFFSSAIEAGRRGFLVKPLTGKTHQIRVALKSLGSPILGDSLYGGNACDRMYLHAWQLKFEYDDEVITCTSEPSDGEIFRSSTFGSWLAKHSAPDNLRWPDFKLPSLKNVHS